MVPVIIIFTLFIVKFSTLFIISSKSEKLLLKLTSTLFIDIFYIILIFSAIYPYSTVKILESNNVKLFIVLTSTNNLLLNYVFLIIKLLI